VISPKSVSFSPTNSSFALVFADFLLMPKTEFVDVRSCERRAQHCCKVCLAISAGSKTLHSHQLHSICDCMKLIPPLSYFEFAVLVSNKSVTCTGRVASCRIAIVGSFLATCKSVASADGKDSLRSRLGGGAVIWLSEDTRLPARNDC
jgi:hypothetical protein